VTAAGQYQYDALSRRVQKVTSSTTLYFYDDSRIVEEQIGATTQATYVYGNYVDEILTMNRLGTDYYYHQNALWSVAAVTDSTGSPKERYTYDAYGAPTITNGSFTVITNTAIGNPWMFTGRQFDQETGVYYYRARYYDPAKGRFLSRDPLGYKDGSNLYWYVKDNPANKIDPLGLSEGCDFIRYLGTYRFSGYSPSVCNCDLPRVHANPSHVADTALRFSSRDIFYPNAPTAEIPAEFRWENFVVNVSTGHRNTEETPDVVLNRCQCARYRYTYSCQCKVGLPVIRFGNPFVENGYWECTKESEAVVIFGSRRHCPACADCAETPYVAPTPTRR
jgi:RHS repeat-associated protein